MVTEVTGTIVKKAMHYKLNQHDKLASDTAALRRLVGVKVYNIRLGMYQNLIVLKWDEYYPSLDK